jgi:hypothetical protein
MIDTTTDDSIKKLLLNNLSRIFNNQIYFVGGICDHVHTGLPIAKIRDIDIVAKLSDKVNFIDRLFNSNFYIQREDGKRFSVKPYKTYGPIRNFGIHKIGYECCDVKSYNYAYHLYIFGICLDIFFYVDNPYVLKKYSRFILNYSTQSTVTNFIVNGLYSPQNNIYMVDYKTRYNDLKNNQETEKRKNKFLLYLESKKNINEKSILNIEEYRLPKLYNPWTYQKINPGLKCITTQDGLIDHYLAHGIKEKRLYI